MKCRIEDTSVWKYASDISLCKTEPAGRLGAKGQRLVREERCIRKRKLVYSDALFDTTIFIRTAQLVGSIRTAAAAAAAS